MSERDDSEVQAPIPRDCAKAITIPLKEDIEAIPFQHATGCRKCGQAAQITSVAWDEYGDNPDAVTARMRISAWCYSCKESTVWRLGFTWPRGDN